MKRFTWTLAGFAAVALACAVTALAAAPETTSPPTITGTPIVGKTLTGGNGLWRNSPTSFSYQWMRCDANGNNCSRIGGGNNKTYTTVDGDVGHTLILLVTAKNGDGSQTANSHPTPVITKAVQPKLETAPSITGKPVVGAQLVADVGTYSGGAVQKYLFQWELCDAQGGHCNKISGGNNQTYTVQKGDVGHTIRVKVTARNDYGATVNESKPTAAVTVATVPTVTTTVTASVPTTICCQNVTLSGKVSSGKAGEPVTILAQEYGDEIANVVTQVTSDATGNWSAKVTPTIQTTYIAQTSTSKASPVTVKVHPRVGFGINGNNFSAKITGKGTFAGAIAFFQILGPSGWKTKAAIVVNTLSVAKFHVALKRGHTYTVRIYLPQKQAGPGLLDGSSHIRKVGGQA
jgi:hypothetical protein